MGGTLAVTLKQLYPPKHVIGRFRLSVTDAPDGAAQALPAAVRAALSKPEPEKSETEATAIAATALEGFARREIAELPPKEVVYGVSKFWSHAKRHPTAQPARVVHVLRARSL